MPNLTISTDDSRAQRSSTPERPPISPITPPPGPVRLGPQQTFTHSQPDQIGLPAPPPVPIDFESNPDVIALKSAISVLQIQRKRATEDVQALNKAMQEAVESPEEFINDLATGKVKHRGPPGWPTAAGERSGEGQAPGEDEDSDSDDGHGDAAPHEEGVDDSRSAKSASSNPGTSGAPRAWTSLPNAQNVFRTPPINWSQYNVVGESLDKLHAEQLERPTQGVPAVFGANGTYEFRAGDGTQEQYKGPAAPYSPMEDKIERGPSSHMQL